MKRPRTSICGHCHHYQRLHMYIKSPGRCDHFKMMGIDHGSHDADICPFYEYRPPKPRPFRKLSVHRRRQ